MIYTWFKIFNLPEFEDLELVSKIYTLELEGLGEKEFLVTKGNLVSITYEDVLISLELNDENPFEFEDFAIYIDDNDDVFFGILVDES